MRLELIAVSGLACLSLLAILAWFCRKRLLRRLRKRQELHVKDAVEFKKAPQGLTKPVSEMNTTRKENPSTKLTDRNHSFLTINKDLSDVDRSGLMNFSFTNNLKLDTVQGTEEADVAQIDHELDIELRGMTYLDTNSAKNSTKNSNKKEFFLNYRKQSDGFSRTVEEVSYEAEERTGDDPETGHGTEVRPEATPEDARHCSE